MWPCILNGRNEPLSNDSNTVLIIGGVQWINNHHLKVTHELLHR